MVCIGITRKEFQHRERFLGDGKAFGIADGWREKEKRIPLVLIGTYGPRSFGLASYSRWIRLAIYFGTSGRGDRVLEAGSFC
jgi:hypothetical protein